MSVWQRPRSPGNSPSRASGASPSRAASSSPSRTRGDMPALNTQSVLNVVEIETERLKLRVAQSLANLQDEAYRKLKQQLLDDRKDYRQMAVSKDERIRVLELQLTGQSNKLETAVLQLLKLAGKSGERYKKLDGIRLCRSVWRQWMRYLILARRERRHERLPEVHFGKVFGRKVLGAWRTAARAERISRVDSYWRSQVEEARTRAASEQQERTESLEAQLAQANEAMRIGVEQRDALEAELKRAFMRGVCALNMEAVSILRHGTAAPTAVDSASSKRTAPGGEELRSLQAQTGEAMLELSKYGPQANRS